MLDEFHVAKHIDLERFKHLLGTKLKYGLDHRLPPGIQDENIDDDGALSEPAPELSDIFGVSDVYCEYVNLKLGV